MPRWSQDGQIWPRGISTSLLGRASMKALIPRSASSLALPWEGSSFAWSHIAKAALRGVQILQRSLGTARLRVRMLQQRLGVLLRCRTADSLCLHPSQLLRSHPQLRCFPESRSLHAVLRQPNGVPFHLRDCSTREGARKQRNKEKQQIYIYNSLLFTNSRSTAERPHIIYEYT